VPDSHLLEKSKSTASAHLTEDRQQLEEAEQTTQNMLQRALENYARALTESDESNVKIFRFCALWLAHSDDDALHSRLQPLLAAIPSYKFVFLAYQLSARLSPSSHTSPSSKNIRRLIQRLCREHLFHTFFPVHALREVPPQGKGSRRSSTTKTDVPKNSRAQAAAEVIDRLKTDTKLQSRIDGLEIACDAYGEWAAVEVKDCPQYVDSRGVVKKGSLKILASMRLKTKVRNLPIPVSTFDLPIDPTGIYPDNSFPHIVNYADTFDTAGGVHVPKIVTCLGSDGKPYRQLVSLSLPPLRTQTADSSRMCAAQRKRRSSTRCSHGTSFRSRQRSSSTGCRNSSPQVTDSHLQGHSFAESERSHRIRSKHRSTRQLSLKTIRVSSCFPGIVVSCSTNRSSYE